MRELQLVGYTADLHHLVFTDADEGGGRFKAAIDEDFVATLDEVFKLTDPENVPNIALGAFSPHQAEPQAGDGDGDTPASEVRGEGPLAGMAVAQGTVDPAQRSDSLAPPAREEEPSSPEPDRSRPSKPSKLAPREIQALLRAGMGPRAVAKEAETDEQWVRRWLAPIEGERDQVLQAVQARYVEKTRLGRSADPVGDAVRKNLASKGLDPDDSSTVHWMAARREGDTYWKVTLRYRSRGRAQRALWRFDPDTGELDPRNTLAVDIAWTRGGKGRSAKSSTERKTSQRSGRRGAKKAGGKKTTVKKAAVKKAAVKKAGGKKTTAKKAAVKKVGGKKTTAKKAAVKKAAGKKTTAKKAAVKKADPGQPPS